LFSTGDTGFLLVSWSCHGEELEKWRTEHDKRTHLRVVLYLIDSALGAQKSCVWTEDDRHFIGCKGKGVAVRE